MRRSTLNMHGKNPRILIQKYFQWVEKLKKKKKNTVEFAGSEGTLFLSLVKGLFSRYHWYYVFWKWMKKNLLFEILDLLVFETPKYSVIRYYQTSKSKIFRYFKIEILKYIITKRALTIRPFKIADLFLYTWLVWIGFDRPRQGLDPSATGSALRLYESTSLRRACCDCCPCKSMVSYNGKNWKFCIAFVRELFKILFLL